MPARNPWQQPRCLASLSGVKLSQLESRRPQRPLRAASASAGKPRTAGRWPAALRTRWPKGSWPAASPPLLCPAASAAPRGQSLRPEAGASTPAAAAPPAAPQPRRPVPCSTAGGRPRLPAQPWAAPARSGVARPAARWRPGAPRCRLGTAGSPLASGSERCSWRRAGGSRAAGRRWAGWRAPSRSCRGPGARGPRGTWERPPCTAPRSGPAGTAGRS
mmetsp:Transcript_112041/g.327669  ORF Transcript_112041/g.327669 Transcript_112041/m.327669 type:complete len:218 (-) Transcript_112041:818-1471(-)